jgi:hypothetical protein
MKVALLFILISFANFAQEVVPFVDFNRYFKSFQDGNFRQIEFQPVRDFTGGDEFVAYTDTKGNLRIFDGDEVTDLSNMYLEYKVSDHLLAWKIGPTVNMWDDGKLTTLTYFGRNYIVKDSLIVFEDLRYNSMKVYWKGVVSTLYTMVDNLDMPVFIGENMVAFKDNGNYYKIFWNGKIYDLGIWNGPIEFQGGTDVIAFNDPTTRTFAVFDKGAFVDIESFYMKKYKAGRNFIVYEDLNGNLNYYKNGNKVQLSNFSSNMWEVKDDLVVWSENSFVYAYENDTKVKVCNYRPEDFLLKNNVFAFRNLMGGVSALVEGTLYDVTNLSDSDYEIYGNSVLVKLFNNSVIVLNEGKKFEN